MRMGFLLCVGLLPTSLPQSTNFVIDPVDAQEAEPATSRPGTMKHQAVMSMDMATWRDIIKTFGIRESMIEHRREQDHQGPGARGWYN